jgi:hypothetical protein
VSGTLLGHMTELELTRTPGDRRSYTIDGVGTLRLEGLWGRRATADAARTSWHIVSSGLWRRTLHATDAMGRVAGEFTRAGLRRGGALSWGDQELVLRSASAWRERYALADGDRELAILDGKGWGKRPVKITVDDIGAVEPGLLLFATFVVRQLAEDASSAAAGGAAGAVAAGS